VRESEIKKINRMGEGEGERRRIKNKNKNGRGRRRVREKENNNKKKNGQERGTVREREKKKFPCRFGIRQSLCHMEWGKKWEEKKMSPAFHFEES
jgi:hypothetical protein